MVSDLSPEFAEDVSDYLSQGNDLPAAPPDLYVTVYDSAEAELDAVFTNARTPVSTGGGWSKTNGSFENANTVGLGEATEDVQGVQYVGLWDSETNGLELARYEIDALSGSSEDVPFDVAQGTQLQFPAGQLSFDVIDYTE